MRFLSLILASTILLLALKPGTDALLLQTLTEQTYCHEACKPTADHEKSSDQQKQNDDCSAKSCNPFHACSSCMSLCLINSVLNLSKPEISTTLNFTHSLDFTSQFTSDFWQPPKIA